MSGVDIPEQPPPAPPANHWAISLGRGAPGIALWWIIQAQTRSADWNIPHAWLTATTREPIPARRASLYEGAPAVAYAIASADRTGYANTLRVLGEHVSAAIQDRLTQAWLRIEERTPPRMGEYDLISGLTGLGAYLLLRAPNRPQTSEVLRYLVECTRSSPLGEGRQLPGCWTSDAPSGGPAPTHPRGHLNLGMAHGVAGPLALLATAMSRGVTVPGQQEAIRGICGWLDEWRQDGPTGTWWPGIITWDEFTTGRLHAPGPQRPSWCYGTPGIARAQQLAGVALGDHHRQRLAEAALLGCITDDHQLALINDASLCHGWAGLLLTVWRAASDAPTKDLAKEIPRLRARIQHQPLNLTQPGLLEGATGLALTLHSTAPDTPLVLPWDACLLTSG